MRDADELADLCQWRAILFASPEAEARALRRHAAYHEQRAAEALVVGAVLRKASAGGWSQLTEREREIVRAYSVGATLPL